MDIWFSKDMIRRSVRKFILGFVSGERGYTHARTDRHFREIFEFNIFEK